MLYFLKQTKNSIFWGGKSLWCNLKVVYFFLFLAVFFSFCQLEGETLQHYVQGTSIWLLSHTKKKEIKESRRKSLLLCAKLCFSSEIPHVHLPLLSLWVSDSYTIPKACAFGKAGHDCEHTELNASSYSQNLQWYRKFLFSVLALSDT